MKRDRNSQLDYMVTIILTFVAMTIIVSFTFGSFYSIYKKNAYTLGENFVSEKAEKLNNILYQSLDVLSVTKLTLDYMIKIGRSNEDIKWYLLQQAKNYTRLIDSTFTGIYGIFRGEYLDGYGWIPEPDYIPQTRPWYQAAVKANGEAVIVPPYLDAQSNKIMISISQTLDSNAGVVSLDLSLDNVQNFISKSKPSSLGKGMVLDKSGLIVAHTDSLKIGHNYFTEKNSYPIETELFKRVLAKNGETFETVLNAESYFVFSRIVMNDWYIVFLVDRNSIFKQVRGNLIRNILISILAFLLVMYFCTSYYKNRKKLIHSSAELREYQQHLEQKVEEQTRQIKKQSQQIIELQESVIEGIASVIEGRDGYTAEHVRNVKQYVMMLANYMYKNHLYNEEIDHKFLSLIGNAAVLHDVGKIEIPDAILNKPGMFTPEEFEVMKKHSIYGGEIIDKIFKLQRNYSLAKVSREVALFHHEKWDGSGYPLHLAGTKIPLSARLMAVADVFDALISKRVYKQAISLEEAFNILKKDSGHHFDPQIVDAFFAIREDVERFVRNKFGGHP